jgi:hypothetical protein
VCSSWIPLSSDKFYSSQPRYHLNRDDSTSLQAYQLHILIHHKKAVNLYRAHVQARAYRDKQDHDEHPVVEHGGKVDHSDLLLREPPLSHQLRRRDRLDDLLVGEEDELEDDDISIRRDRKHD